jgi:histone acetyltransferase (RNA polymerase elongator complex component)
MQPNLFSPGRFAEGTQRLPVPSGSERQLIIPVFLPHLGCPHRCAFCNQRVITQTEADPPAPAHLQRIVETYLRYSRKRHGRIQIAFFGGNFLGMKPAVIRSMLSVAQRFVTSGAVDGIRFSTRPDTIDASRLEVIEPFSIQTVELGVQSMQNDVLERSDRGHTAEDTNRAVERLNRRSYEIGLQLMLGLPGETQAGCFQSARMVAELQPDFVRLYPTVVFSGSRMAEWYRAGLYSPLSLVDCIQRAKQLVLFFTRQSIRIARMGLQSSGSPGIADQIVAGPYHPAFGHLVHSQLFYDMARQLVSSRSDASDPTLEVHPRSVSRLQGMRSENLERLRDDSAIGNLQIRFDPQMPMDGLRLADTGNMLTYADLQCDI